MKEAIQLDITYDQVLSLVRKLPVQQKIKLSKDLEKEGINSKLGEILKSFKTNELSLETINKEVEIVRQKFYERKKH
ncbi:type II toxin-antitoxin system VapB15 family antitoxin [Ferruginibacter sp.]